MANDGDIKITSHNQSGGVTAHTVNVGRTARSLNENTINQMRKEIPKTASVKITAAMGDAEAFGYATQLLDWLKGNGYNNVDGINQAIFTKPVVGQHLNEISKNEFEITIGTRAQ